MKGDDSLEEVLTLTPGQWELNPSTGVISLTEDTLNILLNPEPIENIYILDPEPIARGQFAIVYHCHHRVTGKEFAAKFSSKWRLGSDCSLDLVHEIAVCAMLKPTSRAVQLVDVFSTKNELVLVMEYAPGGDLQTLLDENLVPYERDVIKFMRQLLEGLVFIHDRNIVHLDIKPQNLVLMGEFPDCAVKLCDFEISRMLTPGHEVREILGTPDYVAPEILHYEPITTRTDMWSVGVLTYVLLTGFLPFGGNNDQETFVEIIKCELDFPSELFEDITPEAIDFISKLLIRQPEQRMSAKECLNHSWMRRGLKRPTPPSTLNLTSPLTALMPTAPSKPVISLKVCSEPVKENKQNVGNITPLKTPNNTRLQELSSPAVDIGRPPLHPSSSQKSLYGDITPVPGTPVTNLCPSLASPFFFRQETRFGSRHNLDRLRSLSKSREVISERVQMSNLKVSLSKSRERLCDARLGTSKSREHLMALNSLSQSVEALSALSHLTQQNNLYQSCNNIFATKQNLPQNTSNAQGRMYQSMAAIDQIDKMNYKKIGYFESRISLNGEEYNDMLTQRNTDMNYFIGDLKFEKSVENRATGLRGNNCKGGRGGDSCDNRCTRHRQPEAKLTQKIPKISRADKMKKDAQRRRKEKKEKERQERLKREKENKERERQKNSHAQDTDILKTKTSDKMTQENPSSPSFRRGSVCHVEQRIQERHERNQERLEKQGREEKKGSRRMSGDLDRSHSYEKPKAKSTLLGVNNQRPRSITPTRRKSKKESPHGSDVSQASSMESVEAMTEKTSLNLEERHFMIPNLKVEEITEDEKNNNTLKENNDEIVEDEAYVSLEESCKDIFLRSKSTDSNFSDESDKTVTEIKDGDFSKSSSDDELGLETLSVTEKILSFEKGIIGSPRKQSISSNKQKPLIEIEEVVSCSNVKQLPIISEENSLSKCSTYPSFHRSLSNTSDFGSLVSESSDGSVEREDFSASQVSLPTQTTELLSPDWKSRSRSVSVFSSPSPPLSRNGRSRSNSFNLDDIGIARPWGTVCSGSFARAFEKFNLKSPQSLGTPSPTLSPCEESLPVIQ